MTQLATKNFKAHLVNQIQESFTETSNTMYYIYIGNHVPRSESVLPTPIDNISEVQSGAYRNMILGKRINSDDVKPMIRYIPWENNKIFDMYDDQDTNLYDKDFYCTVNETAYFHVYKCLDNNMANGSTVQPSFTHIAGSNSVVYQTSDGYRWKYMYSYTAATNNQFSTLSYQPVVANTIVSNNAVDGSLEIIKIDTAGKFYNNYTGGTFVSGDVRVGGNNILYRISNTNLQTTNGYYTGCMMYLSTGTGAGQTEKVTHFFTNAAGSYVVLENPFTTPPQNGTIYQIDPEVVITGDGFQTINASGRALINALATNSIYQVEMLNNGAKYSHATAVVVANSVVGVTTSANLRPIITPPGGHGANAQTELGSNYFCVGVSLSGRESNTIPTENDYQKIGILKDPLFANVQVTYTNSAGLFQNNEPIAKITPLRNNINATMNTTSQEISCATGDFLNQYSVGDYIYMKSSNGTSHMISTISAITNSTSLNIASNGVFACTETFIYNPQMTSTAFVQDTGNSTVMTLTNVSGDFLTGDIYIGNTTSAVAEVSSIARNGVTKTFDTFVNMYKYLGSITSGTYTEDEQVFQGVDLATSYANAYIYAAITDGANTTFYFSNQIGIIDTSNTLIGNTSGATASITQRWKPELVYGSGEVLYIENVETNSERSNTTTQSMKIFFQL